MRNPKLSVLIFIVSFLLIIAAAIMYVVSDYTTNGTLGLNLELFSKISLGLGVIGVFIFMARER